MGPGHAIDCGGGGGEARGPALLPHFEHFGRGHATVSGDRPADKSAGNTGKARLRGLRHRGHRRREDRGSRSVVWKHCIWFSWQVSGPNRRDAKCDRFWS